MNAEIQRSIRAVATLALALVAASCAKSGVVAAEPQDVRPVAAESVSGPFVQAGTRFSIIMLDNLDTQASVVGQRFAARVEQDLKAPDGAVVVPAGSRIEGKVARVDSGTTPLLALDFESIGTVWGPASIAAKLEGAEKVTFRGTDEVYDPAGQDHDAFFYPPGAVSYPVGIAPPGMVGYYDYYDENAEEILIPSGSRIRVQLTRPILPPTASGAGGPR